MPAAVVFAHTVLGSVSGSVLKIHEEDVGEDQEECREKQLEPILFLNKTVTPASFVLLLY